MIFKEDGDKVLEILFKTESIVVRPTIGLKPISEKYRNDLFELFSDDENTKYMMPKRHECMEDTDLYLKKMRQRTINKEAIYFGIIHEPEDKLIGFIAIHSINEIAHGVSNGMNEYEWTE